MDADDYSSDTSDEDYVPDGGEVVSEEDESGEDEAPIHQAGDSDTDEPPTTSDKTPTSGHAKRRYTAKRLSRAKVKNVAAASDKCERAEVQEPILTQEGNKKKADALWADFMKDVGEPTKSSADISSLSSSPATAAASQSTELQHKLCTVTVTKEYDFAGETIVVVKEVAADSKEAKQVLESRELPTVKQPTAEPSTASTPAASVKRPASSGSGLSSVLGKIGKKPKISVLDKSKIDWDTFKDNEGIADELKIHNRGKGGYLERQAFLQRTDYRQFEHERSLRMTQSNLPPTSKH